jgi:hypothetical protein
VAISENASRKPSKAVDLARQEPSSLQAQTGLKRTGTRRFPMKLAAKPDAAALEEWQLLRLRAQILEGDIRRAREAMLYAREGGDRTRIDVLATAQTAQRRVTRALACLVPLP